MGINGNGHGVHGNCYSRMKCNGNQWEWTWCALLMGIATAE